MRDFFNTLRIEWLKLKYYRTFWILLVVTVVEIAMAVSLTGHIPQIILNVFYVLMSGARLRTSLKVSSLYERLGLTKSHVLSMGEA
jgi:hypothetical protein